jgi:DNA sulfur modification protein DndD
MNQVFIDSFAVENFGPFYGRKEFHFGPTEERCGVLIGGKNGAGKTHLLRALYLAAVGETGVYDLKNLDVGSDATRFVFDKALNRKAAAEGTDTTRFEISITQRPENGAGAKKLRLIREVTFRPTYATWHSEAIKEDGTKEDDEAVIQRLRDSFLPRHLARFFFFDAERSQGVHLGDRDIVEGISRILGLWSYGELQEDLRSLVANKIPRAYSSNSLAGEETKLTDLMAEVMSLNGHIKGKHGEKEEKQGEIRELESQLANIEDELKALGAIDPTALESDRLRREEIKTSKEQMEGELRIAWETALPIGLLGPFRKELHDYLVQEEKRNVWERSKATVEPKIPGIKTQVFEDVPREFELAEDVHAFYSGRLERALHGLFNPPPDGMANSVYALDQLDVSAQVRGQLSSATAALKSIAELSKNIDRLSSEMRELDSKLKQYQLNAATIARSDDCAQRRIARAAKESDERTRQAFGTHDGNRR